MAADPIVDPLDPGDWRITNPKTPGNVTRREGRLIIRHAPGGGVTWGCAATKRFPDVNMDESPFLVVNVAEMSGDFQVKLNGSPPGWKKATVLRTDSTGLVSVDIALATGWGGKGTMSVSLYTLGDGSSLQVDLVKLTTTPSASEREVEKSFSPPPVAPPHAGLIALAARSDNKPGICDPADGERAIYSDPVTGRAVWRMTDHPAIERHDYYDILAWSADGRTMLFLSRREERSCYWLMDANGTNIRRAPAELHGARIRKLHWHPTEPGILLAVIPESTRTRIVGIDVETGTDRDIASVPFGVTAEGRRFAEFAPPHPDGDYFLLRWGRQDRDPSMLVVVDSGSGAHHVLDLPFTTHRTRFTKHPDHSIFINTNFDLERPELKKRTEWVLALDGHRRLLPEAGGHPDWSPDGTWLAAFSSGGIVVIPYDGHERKLLIETRAGGHGGFSITTGHHHVADVPGTGPYGNMVFVTDVATGIAELVAYHGASYQGWGSGHPDPESTHPSPICSPDETKIVYDSDLLGNADVYVAVWKKPQAPQHVRTQDHSLAWDAPELHREIAGYNVYRYAKGKWELARRRVETTSVEGLGEGRYAVSAEEWSGLESQLREADTGESTVDVPIPRRPEGLRITDAAESWALLAWTHPEAKAIDHFNVYGRTDGLPDTGRNHLLGSPTVARFVDWGFPDKASRRYRVTAVDRHGNESPSVEASGTEPAR